MHGSVALSQSPTQPHPQSGSLGTLEKVLCFHPLFPDSSASEPVNCKTLGALRGGGRYGREALFGHESEPPSFQPHLSESSALG